MNSYSHIAVAAKLESLVRPADPSDYYWGAVVPDIRYLAAMRRRQTHLPIQELVALGERYPHLGSFVQGYLVHCLTDQIELSRIFYRHLPFSLLKGRLTHQHLAILLELYFLERWPAGRQVSGTHNEVLDELGVSRSVMERFAQTAQPYAAGASTASLADLVRLMGLKHDARIEKYVSAARQFQENRLLKMTLFLGVRAARIDERIIHQVAALYRRHGAAVG